MWPTHFGGRAPPTTSPMFGMDQLIASKCGTNYPTLLVRRAAAPQSAAIAPRFRLTNIMVAATTQMPALSKHTAQNVRFLGDIANAAMPRRCRQRKKSTSRRYRGMVKSG
jgi:hypothetical protein